MLDQPHPRLHERQVPPGARLLAAHAAGRRAGGLPEERAAVRHLQRRHNTLLQPFLEADTSIVIDVDSNPMEIPRVTFRGIPSALGNDLEDTTAFDFGYAMTVHKAQGSEWDSVILVDEYRRYEQRKEWLYTGITRAAERILIVQ